MCVCVCTFAGWMVDFRRPCRTQSDEGSLGEINPGSCCIISGFMHIFMEAVVVFTKIRLAKLNIKASFGRKLNLFRVYHAEQHVFASYGVNSHSLPD